MATLCAELSHCVIAGITSTYFELPLHCNHNRRSSVHMSALIPFKPTHLLGTERAGLLISLFAV